MNAITKRIEIDVYSPTSYEIVKAQQGDNISRILEFVLYNQGEPYIITDDTADLLAVMEGRRGDHSSFIKDCSIKDNIITAVLDSDILCEAGTIQSKIFLYDAKTNAILSTIPFQIFVQPDPCEKNRIESEKSSAMDWLTLQLHKLKNSFTSHLTDTVSHITASERTNWNDAYSKRHTHSNKTLLDNTTASYTIEEKNKLAGIQSGAQVNLPSDWKDSVSTYAEIASTYPNPKDGWTVNVQDTDYTYRYNGTEWIAISANAIPTATSATDGLFSKEDYGRFELMCSESISLQQPYAVCSEAMGAQAKTVSIPEFILTAGAKVTVKFANGNSAASPTLNVSGTGAKEIYYNGAPVSRNFIKRESVHDFIYDGTHWLMEGEKGAGYYHVTCATEADKNAKSVTLAGFRLVNGAQLILQFTHGNTAENPTLNVQNTGAYPIYYGGMPVPPGYITANSAVQLIFDGQNHWVVVGDFLQQQMDDLKRFVHFEEIYWNEKLTPVQDEGFVWEYSIDHGSIYPAHKILLNNTPYAKCTYIPIINIYDSNEVYKIITHNLNFNETYNLNHMCPIGIGYNRDIVSDLSGFSMLADTTFDMSQTGVIENIDGIYIVKPNKIANNVYIKEGVDMLIFINSWGVPSDITIYRGDHKIW